MKKEIKLLGLSLLILVFIFTSCAKKKEAPEPDPVINTPAPNDVEINNVKAGYYYYYEISSGIGNDITYWAGDTVIFDYKILNGRTTWYFYHKLNYLNTPYVCSAFNYDTTYLRPYPGPVDKSSCIEYGNITFNQFFYGAGNWSDSVYSKSILENLSDEFKPNYIYSGDVTGPHVPTIPLWMASYYEGTKYITNVTASEHRLSEPSMDSLPDYQIVRNNHFNQVGNESIQVGKCFMTNIEYYHPTNGIINKKTYRTYSNRSTLDIGAVLTNFEGGSIPILLTEVKPMYLSNGNYKRELKSFGSINLGE